jgi:hypothetical protein
MILTHMHPDLDALASAWLARRMRGNREEVRFVPASWPGPVSPQDLAVDIPAGIKGRLDPATGRVSSAFLQLLVRPEAGPFRRPLAPLAALVEAQDTTGCGLETLAGRDIPEPVRAHGLPALIEAARQTLQDDARILEWASCIFDGILLQHDLREKESRQADAARWSGPVALVEGDAAGELFRRGARAVVYSDGPNLGALRARDETFHLGDILEPWLRARGQADGWFFHSAGFIACHGSRKAPAAKPPAVPAVEVALHLSEYLQERLTVHPSAPAA